MEIVVLKAQQLISAQVSGIDQLKIGVGPCQIGIQLSGGQLGADILRPLEKFLVYHLAAEQPGGFYRNPILFLHRDLAADGLPIGHHNGEGIIIVVKWNGRIVHHTCGKYQHRDPGHGPLPELFHLVPEQGPQVFHSVSPPNSSM